MLPRRAPHLHQSRNPPWENKPTPLPPRQKQHNLSFRPERPDFLFRAATQLVGIARCPCHPTGDTKTCHSDRSGPTFSSAPVPGASGRVVEESRHPFHFNRRPAILTIYGCLLCLYSGQRFRCPLHRHNQFSRTPRSPAQNQALPRIHRNLRRHSTRLF
jgi:hypothetical protein